MKPQLTGAEQRCRLVVEATNCVCDNVAVHCPASLEWQIGPLRSCTVPIRLVAFWAIRSTVRSVWGVRTMVHFPASLMISNDRIALMSASVPLLFKD